MVSVQWVSMPSKLISNLTIKMPGILNTGFSGKMSISSSRTSRTNVDIDVSNMCLDVGRMVTQKSAKLSEAASSFMDPSWTLTWCGCGGTGTDGCLVLDNEHFIDNSRTKTL